MPYSLTLYSGQSVTVNFQIVRDGYWGDIDFPVGLSVGPVPPGITAALSTQSLSPDSSEFSLTLTAAEGVTPAEATIEVQAAIPTAPAAASAVTVNAVAYGQVWPAYHLLTVLYAPPGTKGSKSSSQVSYASGSTTGTTDSISNSFKDGIDVSVSAGLNIPDIVNIEVSGDFNASQTSTTTSQVNITKGANNVINVTGPNTDGINHGNDLFYLWLNPQLNMTIDHLGNVAWEIGVNGQDMLIQYVYAEWLKDPSLMPPGTAHALAAAGLTTADYPYLLACNPFSTGATAIDPNRFVPTTHSFPYEPPATAGATVPTITYTLTSSTTATNIQEVQTKYTASVTVSTGFDFIFKDTVKVTGSLEWTNTSTSTQTTGSTQQASVTVGGPAFGYTGPTDVLVYWDTVYQSFMFAFATGSPSASGTITDGAGNPVPNKAITLTAGGITLSTFTNSRGQYRFYGAAPGHGTVAVEDRQFSVAVGPGEPSATLRLNPPTPV